MLQGGLSPQNQQIAYSEYTLEERAKMGRYGTIKRLVQGYQTLLFLSAFIWQVDMYVHVGYIVHHFLVEGPNSQVKTHKIKKYCILAEIEKCNAHQIFLLYGS